MLRLRYNACVMAASITTDNLTKFYPGSTVPALDKLTLVVKPGEVYGYLGANGAGKSTTIRLLMNFLQPSSGAAQIAGLDVVQGAVAIKKRVGYLAGDVALYQKTTGKELLNYLADLQGGVDSAYRKILEKRFEAETDKPISSLSKGNRQKIGILQACMHRPDVLILDEPTSGLDPLMQEAFYETIHEASQRGAATLMSSHNLAEAGRVCDRIGIIKHGKLIHEQAISDESTLGSTTFRVVFKTRADVAKIKSSRQLKLLSENGNVVVLQPRGSIADALAGLSKFDIVSLTTQQLSLEDEFLDFYGDKQ
jgi:ABC-2 type transport system ATP-binding protein